MKLYIRATGNVSPQRTFGHPPFLAEPVLQTGNRLRCVEPDYRSFIDAKLIRRMSRIIKMGVAAAMECLQEAGTAEPEAIVTGTAYGCMEDTGVFLEKMISNREEMLTPTSFIQSTHNTVGAQIALMLGCHRYNNTFVHKGFSFESALLDSMMQILDGDAEQVLAGSVDEITDTSHAVLSRFGLYRNDETSNLDIIRNPAKGTIAGEGAAFFLLSGNPSSNDYATLDAVSTFYKPENENIVHEQVSAFLSANHVTAADIDLVITGKNGEINGDKIYDQVTSALFANKPETAYKHLCGEYPTSTSFAMWVAANILKSGILPPVLNVSQPPEKISKILVYNHHQLNHHSLFLFSAC
jgi:3-oxoacyl-(acyl-carrier-protein) synthase